MATKNNPDDNAEEIEVKSAPKVNDVAKPGSTAAPQTSRPIITNHGAMIKKDPMVSGKEDGTDGKEVVQEEEKSLAKKSEVRVTPISAPEKTEPSGETKEEPAEASEEQADISNQDEAAAEKPKEETGGSETAAIDSLAGSAENKKTPAKEAEAEKARQQKIQELVASRKYNVSITEGGRKGTGERIITWLLFLLLLCSIGAYLAADAGYLDIGIDLPYDLIKNNP